MLAWILDYAGLEPGFLIGGLPGNFGLCARLGSQSCFVVEADEYDTAFFDKRSKFVHYRPRTLVINNLEFDHADIFADLAGIQRQFHHLVRTVPASGQIIVPAEDARLNEVLEQGCWSRLCPYGPEAPWQAVDDAADSSSFTVRHKGAVAGQVRWSLSGRYNRDNALAAILAASQVGVSPAQACEALATFQGGEAAHGIAGLL